MVAQELVVCDVECVPSCAAACLIPPSDMVSVACEPTRTVLICTHHQSTLVILKNIQWPFVGYLNGTVRSLMSI